jgi:hypothetical protein
VSRRSAWISRSSEDNLSVECWNVLPMPEMSRGDIGGQRMTMMDSSSLMRLDPNGLAWYPALQQQLPSDSNVGGRSGRALFASRSGGGGKGYTTYAIDGGSGRQYGAFRDFNALDVIRQCLTLKQLQNLLVWVDS